MDSDFGGDSEDDEGRDALYRTLLDAPFEGIAVHIDGQIIEANAELQRMTGFGREELLSKGALDLFAPESHAKVLEKIRQGATEPYEAVGLHCSGMTFPVQIRGKAIQFRGQTARLVAARDISGFKAVESALRESEQRFHDFARSGSDWFWEMGPDLRFTYISSRFEELTGSTSEGVVGLTRREVATPEQLAAEPERWEKHFADLEAHRPFTNFEYKFVRGPGEGVFISLDGVPIFAEDGTFLGYRGTGSDVSNRKQIEEQLAHSERDLRTIINNMPDIFYRTDKEGRFVAFSPAAVDMLGYSAEELMGMALRDCYVNPEDRQVTLSKIMAGAGKPVLVEGLIRRKDGSSFIASIHSFVRYDENGEMDGVEGIARDITEYKKAEQQIIDAKMKAEEANMAKTRFLAAASHDLRQPLQAINLYLAVLMGKSLTPDTADVIGHIEASVGALNNLLESLLDISRLEAGLVQAEAEVVSIGEILTRLGAEFAQVCAEKGLSISVAPTSLRVRADPVLLEVVLRNLLANAVNYTDHGKILLGCRRRGDKVALEVWDTGVGIPASQLPHIFEEFYQLDNQGRNRNKGLGLGLSIVEKMAKVLQGAIGVRSWEGQGSVFALTLPSALADAPSALPAQPAASQTMPNLSIIVIDDDAEILSGMKMLLEAQGHEVRVLCCVDCRNCQDILKDMTTPDIIIADYRLQEGRSGVEAVRVLRDRFKVDVPAIILTGDTAPSRLAEVMSSGLPIMHKPIDANALRTEIMRFIDI